MTGNNSPHAFMYPSASSYKLNPPRPKRHGITSVLQGNVDHMPYVFSPCRRQPLAYYEGAHDYFLLGVFACIVLIIVNAGDIIPAYMQCRIEGSDGE